jgi:hypothetical protein
MNMWLLHPDFKAEIDNCWNTIIHGCPMFILCKKLKMLKDRLKIWNKDVFGNVHDQLKKSEDKVNSIQEKINVNGYSDDLMAQDKQAQIDLDLALQIENAFWQEKAKVKWSFERDRNTSYFHRISKIKSTTKMITSLKIGNELISNPDDLANHVVHHFSKLFGSNHVLQDNNLIEEVIPNLLNDDLNRLLTLTPSHAEIKNVVFALNRNSAPGPDDFGAIFFQTFWDIIHTDVINVVLQFFQTG